MRYIPTIDIWATGIQAALYSGQLRLQVGQWLTCGTDNEHKCRFVSASRGLIWVVHWQGTGKATFAAFKRGVSANSARLAA
jgi:hypothetical protein